MNGSPRLASLQAQEAAAAKESGLAARKQALEAAESQAGSLRSQVQQREAAYHEASRHAEEVHKELLASKRHVDLAQARKEEVRLGLRFRES